MNPSSIEKEIIRLLKSNDQSAISLLYKHYANSLYGVIIKIIKDPDIAEDALQETFIKVWKNSSSYNPEKAKLFTWLFRIAKNTAIDKLRNYNKTTQKNIQIKTSNVFLLPAEQLNQDVLDLKKHVSALDNKYKDVLYALYFDGLTQQEASKALNIPLGTVKSRLKIGLRELGKVYEK